MAIKLTDGQDVLPGTVKAVVAKHSSSLQHQAMARVKNAESLQKVSQMLNRIRKNG